MTQAATRIDVPDLTRQRPAARTKARPCAPFAGMIEMVLVEEPVQFAFTGSLSRKDAETIWTWVVRDLCPDLISAEGIANGNFSAADLELILTGVSQRARQALLQAGENPEALRRLRAMMGSAEVVERVPQLLVALRNRALLGKAQAFGKAVNAIADEAALGQALQSMPIHDPAIAALVFHAAMGQIVNPLRVVAAIIKLSGNATEQGIARNGFGPVIEAMLAHAQNQVYLLQPHGPFADIDLVCRALERFHRLVRALTGYIEFARGSRWANALSGITKQVSDRIEPKLRDIVPDINQALRRGREGNLDRLDDDRLLAALNGVYLLKTIRDCRDSLALNALFDQAWSQTGQALELHLQRNLDLLRQNPSDSVVVARLEAGIKMAEIRFNADYAETLRRARTAAERRF